MMNTEKLWKCSQPSLRDFLKEKGKDPQGNKQELIARVVNLGLENDLIEFSDKRPAEEPEKEDNDGDAQDASASDAPRKRAREEQAEPGPADKRPKVKEEVANDEPEVFRPIPGKEYSTAELAQLSKADLAQFCIAKELTTHGSKDTLLMRILQNQVEKNQAAGGAGGASSSSTAKSELVAVKASPAPDGEGGSGAGECALCLAAAANMAMVPCGHLCLCKGCATENEFTECPICRCQVSTIMPIYHNFAEDEAPPPEKKSKKKGKTKKKDAKKSAADMKAELDAEKIRALPKTWEGVVQPREEFLMRVPWDEDSQEDPLALRCLLCEKWAEQNPESHGKTDGSVAHMKNLRSLPLDPTWWSDKINKQKEQYFTRYPVLKRVPFPDLTVEEEPDAKDQANEDDRESDEDDDEVVCMGGGPPGIGEVLKRAKNKGPMSDLDFLEMIATTVVFPVTIELYPLERDRVKE